MNNEITNHLRNAITTLRDFADQAERAIERYEAQNPLSASEMIIGQVQAKLTWGLANASSSIGDALSTITYEREQGNA